MDNGPVASPPPIAFPAADDVLSLYSAAKSLDLLHRVECLMKLEVPVAWVHKHKPTPQKITPAPSRLAPIQSQRRLPMAKPPEHSLALRLVSRSGGRKLLTYPSGQMREGSSAGHGPLKGEFEGLEG